LQQTIEVVNRNMEAGRQGKVDGGYDDGTGREAPSVDAVRCRVARPA
jgi:hypothetical protein